MLREALELIDNICTDAEGGIRTLYGIYSYILMLMEALELIDNIYTDPKGGIGTH